MITLEELEKIKAIASEFFQKLMVDTFSIDIGLQAAETPVTEMAPTDSIFLHIALSEPQLFIGQNGQTLFEIERLLRMILCKSLKKNFYINLDINEYKKKKIENLKKLANDIAREVVITQEKKTLPAMSSYERRIVHDELSHNTEVVTESEGEGPERRVVIKPV